MAGKGDLNDCPFLPSKKMRETLSQWGNRINKFCFLTTQQVPDLKLETPSVYQ